jgi:hypothetical protein
MNVQLGYLTSSALTFDNDINVNAVVLTVDNTVNGHATFSSNGPSTVRLSGITTPTDANDAANKAYVDSLVASGIAWKDAVQAATTTNIAVFPPTDGITTTSTIDGVTLNVGDRVLVKDQTTASQNGIWLVNAGAWTRTDDAASGTQATGAAVYVFGGSVNIGKAWVCPTNTGSPNFDPVNFNSAITFVAMSSSPAVAGSNTQVQYNNNSNFGADASFTYNGIAATPVLSIGGAATGLSTLNLGTGSQASSILSVGTGAFTVSGAGNSTFQSSAGTVTLSGTTASVTASTGSAAITGENGASMTATNGTASLVATDNDVSITSGAATTMTATTTSSITSGGIMTMGSTAAATNIGASSTSITVGSASTTTTDVNAITLNVGSSSTTTLNLLATGVGGDVVMTAGDATSSGTITLSTTTATTATVAGGDITMTAGNGNTTGAGGALDFNAGSGGATGAGGAITINAGAGGATSGLGGNLILQAGSANAYSSAGNLVLKIAVDDDTPSTTNNIIQFQDGAGDAIGRINNLGNIYMKTFFATSDVQYKTNIESINDPLNTINKIEGYSYDWKDPETGLEKGSEKQLGVIAQQLESIGLGNLVNSDGKYKSVNYLGLIPILIEAIKELNRKVDSKIDAPAPVLAPVPSIVPAFKPFRPA